MPAPPLIRLGSSCCNHLLKKCSLNNNYKYLLRCQLSVVRSRLVAYTTTTCSDHQQVSSEDSSSSSNTSSDTLEKLGKFKVIETLDHLRKQPSSTLLFIAQLKESGLKHDFETYMAIVRLLCDSGMVVRLNNLFMYLVENNTNSTGEAVGFEMSDLLEALIEEKLIKAVGVLVRVYASLGRFDEAIHALSQMKRVSTGTCNFVMNKLIEWDKVDKVESVYGELKRNGMLIPNVYTYGILMEGHCKKGCLKEAWDVFEQMDEAGVEPNASIYGTYIHGLCSKGGNTDSAFQLLKNLMESNKPVDHVFAYTCVIRGFFQESKLQDAEDAFLDMKRRQVVPDVHCYGVLIQGYCEKREIEKAYGLIAEMESRGLETNDMIVWSMMECLCGYGRLHEAVCLFKRFMESSSKGVFIDGVTFNIAMDAACRLRRMDDVMGFVEEMKARKMELREMHYRTLMTGNFLCGDPWNALNIFEEMIGKQGVTPDSKTFDVLVKGLIRSRFYGPLYMLLFGHKLWNHTKYLPPRIANAWGLELIKH